MTDRTPWIQNVPLAAVAKAHHFFEPDKTVLIQIQDKGTLNFVKPMCQDFVETYQFAFDDNDDPHSKANINDFQAADIAAILKKCLEKRWNVVVHCHAGLCRSGAVAEVGVQLGFQDTEMKRIPNVLVMNRLRSALGLVPDYEAIFCQLPNT